MHINNPSKEDAILYQRLVKGKKIKEIREFISEKSNFFPNAVLLSSSEDDIKNKYYRVDKNKLAKGAVGAKSVQLTFDKYNFINVIDGQHRIYGYSGLKEADSHLILVNLLEGINGETERKIFVDVNSNATKVDSSLQWELFDPLYKDADNSKPEFVKSLISRTVKKMVKNIHSPLYHKLKTPSIEGSIKSNMTFVAFCSQLDRSKIYSQFESIDEDTFESILLEYIRYFENELPDLWNLNKGEKGFYLQHNMGMTSLIALFKELVDHIHIIDPKYKKLFSGNKTAFLKEILNLVDFLIQFINQNYDNVIARFDELRVVSGLKGVNEGCIFMSRCIHSLNSNFSPKIISSEFTVEEKQILELIDSDESTLLEFKSSFAYDINERELNEQKILPNIIKAIAGFLNSYDGGQLIVGVDENGKDAFSKIVGIEFDILQWTKKKNLDDLELYFRNKVVNSYFKDKMMNIVTEFKKIKSKHICLIDIKPSDKPIFIRYKNNLETFFVRKGNSTEPLSGQQIIEYSRERFKK